jgi:hypothetical protein
LPQWLSERMSSLGAVVCQAIVHHYGRDELLARLAHPFWFQSFGAVMGMDWHSSGITTSVIGALKRGLGPIGNELDIHVCGGRGRHSRRTPDELMALGDRVGFDGQALTRASRLVAKVDSAAVQDGFDLYLRGFFVTDDGKWTVVQQGMNGGQAAGAPLPLAFRKPRQLRRDAAQRDRRTSAGRDRQSHRQARSTLTRRAARPTEGSRAGQHRPRRHGDDRGAGCPRHASSSDHAGASRREVELRVLTSFFNFHFGIPSRFVQYATSFS